MRDLERRLLRLEQYAATVPPDLPPLPPPGASEEDLDNALHEAWRQLQANPSQRGWFLHLVRIAQRFGVSSTIGAEDFTDEEDAIEIPPVTI